MQYDYLFFLFHPDIIIILTYDNYIYDKTQTKDSTDLAQEHALKRFVEMIVLDRSKVISKTTTMQAVVCQYT